MKEQAIIKLPGTEIPYGALNDWKMWLLIGCFIIVVWLWKRK